MHLLYLPLKIFLSSYNFEKLLTLSLILFYLLTMIEVVEFLADLKAAMFRLKILWFWIKSWYDMLRLFSSGLRGWLRKVFVSLPTKEI